MSIEGKLIYILGGSGKIGSAVAEHCNKHKAKIINLDLHNSENNSYVFEKFDVSEIEHISQNLESITSRNGVPEVFINCSYPRSRDWASLTFEDSTLDNLKENINLHLLSYVWTSNFFGKKMSEHQIGGSIILTSSIYGIIPQKPNLYKNTNLSENIAYPAIKAGINQHCKQMATFYGKYNIRVNSISPGGLEGEVAGKKIKQDETFKTNYIKRTPLGRMCKVSDLVDAYRFLASSDSSYITGQNLIIDGGFTLS